LVSTIYLVLDRIMFCTMVILYTRMYNTWRKNHPANFWKKLMVFPICMNVSGSWTQMHIVWRYRPIGKKVTTKGQILPVWGSFFKENLYNSRELGHCYWNFTKLKLSANPWTEFENEDGSLTWQKQNSFKKVRTVFRCWRGAS